jgi:hypothetical protein
MFSAFFKKNLPHILVLACFLLVTIAYFSPMFFEHKGLAQGDVMQGVGGSQELAQYQKQTGKSSLWTNALFSGMPSIMVSTGYPGNLMGYIYKYISLGMPRCADMIFLSLLGFYVLMLAYGVRPILAAAGSFAFAFSTYTIVSIEAGHNAKVTAMAFMPMIIAGMVWAYRKNLWVGCAILAVGLAQNLITNHVQITFYAFLTSLFFLVSELLLAIKQKTLKTFILHSAGLAVAALIAVGTHAGYLMSVTEYGQYSIRGKSELKPVDAGNASEGLDKDYAFDWSYAPAETMTLLIPRFYGGSSNENVGIKSETYQTLTGKGVPAGSAKDFTKSLPTYWGELPFTSGPLYIGAIIIFLAVLGFLILDGYTKYWLLAASIFSLFLTWGKHFETFNYFLFDYLPLFNKFRAVMMAIVIAQLTLPLLAMLSLEKVLQMTDKEVLKKKLFIAFGITGGLCVIVLLLGGSMFDFTSEGDVKMLESFKSMTGDATFAQQIMDSIVADRASMMQGDALRSLIFVALVAGLVYLFILGKLKEAVVVLGSAILVFLDLWTLDKNYLNASSFVRKPTETYFSPSLADQSILQDTALSYRVFNLSGNPFTENRTSYFHKSIGGNNPAKLRRYQDLIERHLSKNNEKVLNMLNAKYAIISPEQPPQLIPGALGNGWFVSEIKAVNSPDEEIAALDNFEPAKTAVIDVSQFKTVGSKTFEVGNNNVTLQEATLNYLKYNTSSDKDGLVVFSEIYYPKGWVTTIDGKEADLLRANYVLRAMYVPAGNHTIEMKFDLPSYHTGNTISLISSILLYAGVLGIVAMGVVNSRKQSK